MSWIVLVVSGVFESVWAIALDHSEGFTKPVPVIVFVVALVLSMGGLSYAMRDIGVGTSYAVWVGIGAMITVCYSMITGAESFSWVKMLLILGLVGCVVGLKLAA
ncbi:multidrug efflux SMR transporter [uncultured Bifidobacterium sp.]|uniref:DMT family transporter n=1 Tax=uncultured Bifidobacterium sp. TaxID=165187 RepID=UPI002583DEFF|nr:multidrug efflux SMR transporter [uncultured Bifidobacterium sp.]